MARYVFLLLACLFLLSTSREPPWADAHVAYDTTRALVDRRELRIDLNGPAYFFSAREGRKYGKASLGHAISMVPSYLTYKALRRLTSLPDEPLYALCAHLMPALLMAGACALFLVLCRRRGATGACAVGLTLGLGLTTICFIYARSPYAEALQTFALVWLVERTLAQARQPTLGGMASLGLAAGVLFTAKLVYVAVLPLCATYVLYVRLRDDLDRRRLLAQSLAAVGAFLPFVALALWHNVVKTGSPWHTGYEVEVGFFSGQIWPALHGNLVSPGKSLFLYSPPVVLGLIGLPTAWRRDRRATLLLLGVITVTLLLHARFRIWHGGYCWGPRYLVPLTPLFMLLAVPWLPAALARGRRQLRTALVGVLLAWGAVVQVLGAAFYWDHFIRMTVVVRDQTRMQGWSQDHYAHLYYVPQFSPIAGHAWLLKHLIRRDPDLNRDAPWKELVPRAIPLTNEWQALRIDVWAADWLAAKRPPIMAGLGRGPVAAGVARSPVAGGVILLVLLAGGAVASGVLLRRQVRREDAPGVATSGDAAGSGPAGGA
jgi:hypothetical protein